MDRMVGSSAPALVRTRFRIRPGLVHSLRSLAAGICAIVLLQIPARALAVVIPSAQASDCPCYVALTPDGTKCFTVVVRDPAGNPMAGATVLIDLADCATAIEPITGLTDSKGSVSFCICGSATEPCTANIFANGARLCTVPILNVAPAAPPPLTIFQDPLDGTSGAALVGTVPATGGGAWTLIQGSAQELVFAPSGGVEDLGPNSVITNAVVRSTLATPVSFTSLGANEMLHLQVTMQNRAAIGLFNLLQSSRVDLITNTSGGAIYLGEVSTEGRWGANSAAGSAIKSDLTTGLPGNFLLDLFLDPHDVYGDGTFLNAILTVNKGKRFAGHIGGLSCATVISAVQLARNVDDEVRFDDITLEISKGNPGALFLDNWVIDCSGGSGTSIASSLPRVGGTPWSDGGLVTGQFLKTATGGVEDAGPNNPNSNSYVHSDLTEPLDFSTLAAGEVVHLSGVMANISASPGANPLESSRIDLITNTSGTLIALGELATGGNWGANSVLGNPITSDVSTAQSGPVALDLYLDPNDVLADSSSANAYVRVNNGSLWPGTIVGLSSSPESPTIVSAIRLVRNVDDEVFFNQVVLERVDLSPPSTVAVDSPPPPERGALFAYPNPFRTSIAIRFNLDMAMHVNASVYDVAGRHLRTLHSGLMNAGWNEVPWNGTDAAGRPVRAGTYFVRILSGTQVIQRRVVSLR